MKYTRYNIKKNNNKKHVGSVVVLCLLLIALFTAILVSPKLSSHFKGIEQVSNKVDENKVKINKFYLIQLGAFNKVDGAKKFQTDLSATVGDTYLITDTAVTRVIRGIYAEDKLSDVQKELTDKKIEYSKMTFNISYGDLCNKEITEILKANLQVLNKLSEKDVQSFNSEELMKWLSTLEKVDEKSTNYVALKQLRDRTQSYGDKITKDKLTESYKFIFDIFKTIK